MKHYMSQSLDGFGWKLVGSTILSVITIIQGFYGQLIWGLMAMFIIDLITGISKSIKNGVPITSRRLRDSGFKLLGYIGLITALTILAYFQKEVEPFVTLVYYFFIFTEFKSILENVQEMGVKIPQALMSFVNARIKNPAKKGRKKEDDTKSD